MARLLIGNSTNAYGEPPPARAIRIASPVAGCTFFPTDCIINYKTAPVFDPPQARLSIV